MAIPDGAVVNSQGQVAMKYRRLVPITVRCGGHPNYHYYVFAIRANIPLAWVNEDDLPCMTKVKWGCCGQKKPGGVILANANDVRQWTNGGGR